MSPTMSPSGAVRKTQEDTKIYWFPVEKKERGREGGRSVLQVELTRSRKHTSPKVDQAQSSCVLSRSVSVFAPRRSVVLGCCCLCCEEALCAACCLRQETAMMKGTAMFASLLKRDSRAHAPNIEPKPASTFPQNETLAVSCWDTSCMGLLIQFWILDCFLGKCSIGENGCTKKS